MPRYKGDKFRWKGVTDCTRRAKLYPQSEFNSRVVLDLWLTADQKRVYVEEREWINAPEIPTDKENGDIYCGEITRHDVKTGDVEYMVLRELDRRANPWRYKEWHFFLVDRRKEQLIEIPKYLPITDIRWVPVSKPLEWWTHIEGRIKVYSAGAKVLKMFNEHPDRQSMMVEFERFTILIRGHGYYDTHPAPK